MDTRQAMPRKKNKHVYEDGEESSLFNLFDDFENTEPTDNSKRHEVKDIEGELSCEEIVREQKKAKHNNDIVIDASEKMFTILHHPINGRNIKSLGDLQNRLSKFFDLNYEPTKDEWQKRETVNDLAIWLGYGGRTNLIQSIRKNSDPDYTYLLQAAVDILTSTRQEFAWERIKKQKNPGRDMIEFLKLEKEETSTVVETKENKIDITISKKDELIAESVKSSLASIDFFDDAEVKDNNRMIGHDTKC